MAETEDAGDPGKHLRIAIVGPCASGKSTLAATLSEAGYETRQPAQEHSYVPNMWQRLARPDLLIYLDVDYANVLKRVPHIDGGPQRLVEQSQRLIHARQNCDLYLDTSGIDPAAVRQRVFAFLRTYDAHE